MSFAGVTASHLVAAIQYRSVKFSTLPLAKAEEIARALLLRVLLEEIEAVQQDPGKGNSTVIFKTISTAKHNLFEENLPTTGSTIGTPHLIRTTTPVTAALITGLRKTMIGKWLIAW